MSLDLYLEEMGWHDVWGANITHNVSPMWREAGVYDALYNSEGKACGDVLPILLAGHEKMCSDREKYEALNPSNGWGSYEAAIEFLRKTIDACCQHPSARFRVSK